MSRPLLFVLLAALCAGAAFLTTEPDAEGALAGEALRLQRRVGDLQQDLVRSTEQEAVRIANEGASEWMRRRAGSLEERHSREGSALYVFQADSLVAWSGEMPFAGELLLADSSVAFTPGANILLHVRVRSGPFAVHAIRSLWNAPPVHNKYLTEGFHPSLHAPPGLRAQGLPAPGPVITDPTGSPLFGLAWSEGAMEMGDWLFWRMALLAITAILLVSALWSAYTRAIDRLGAIPAAGLFISSLMLLRWASLVWGTTAPFDRWPLFDPAIYATSSMFPSLGDLLINAALLVVGAVFLLVSSKPSAAPASAIAGFIRTALVLAFGAWITRLCIGVVNDSSIDLDLYHVQGVGAFGLVALFAMALLMASWCVFAWSMVRATAPSPKSWPLVVASSVALVLSIVVHQSLGIVDTILFLWPVPVIVLMITARVHSFRFLQGVLMIGLLAAASTHILTKYTHNREQRERVVLAERLAAREDPVVEQLFRAQAPTLRRDTAIHRLLTSNRLCVPGELDALVRQPYFSGYWDRYDIRLFAFGPQGDVRCATDLEPPRTFGDSSNAFPTGVSDMPDLFIDERSDGELFYHARIAVMPTDSSAPAQLIVEAQPRSLSQGLGFPELLLAGDDDLARRAERYAQARYVNGMLMDQSGRAPQPQHWSAPLDDEGELWYTAHGFDFLAKAVGNSTVMVLGLPQRGIVDKATTFSYLFTFFGLLALLTLAIHALLTRSLPSLGIGTKVRAALVLFAITGLLFFGVGSQRLLSRQFTQRAETASLEKARSVQLELQRRLGEERITGAAHTAYLEHLLGQLSNTFHTDITVYAPDGRLLASSRPQMFSSGLLAERMDPAAYASLALAGESSFVHEERVGQAAYRTAYVPLLDHAGAVIAHIALPRFADQVQQEEERSELFVAVVNLFVLLFVLSVLLAIFISNWTTRPLDVLKQALGGVVLQGANEPIRYRGKDEVGELVAVYNRKVEELRESAERLAQSERESAWKEMARQVAHEIKNPLTPMKLGIQHFQRSWDPSSPDARERLDRFSASMVEQIDALSRVAGDFSRFAQMSAARESLLDLSEVARNAVTLLAGEPNVEVTVETPGPLMVLADREHLLRVLNNLLKNAVQAIPAERRRSVHVVLRRHDGQAVLEVRDNGTGIPEDVRERIFEPSFTTKSSGMGLGLAMVKRMVEQAGGTVRFETEEGTGTRFFVSLPLQS